jgi:hypothetical protein
MSRMTTTQVGLKPQARAKLLVQRVQNSLAQCGLHRIEYTSTGDETLHTPRVVAADARPPAWVQIDMLPGQSTEDFAAHASAIAHHLGVPYVWVVPLGRSRIRLELPAQHENSKQV